MFQPEDDTNKDLAQNSSLNGSDPNLENIDSKISAERIAIRKKQLEDIFKKLIISGLTLGTILGLITYYLLNRFGLTKKPYQIEQERLEREEAQPDVEKIDYFPASDNVQKRFEL